MTIDSSARRAVVSELRAMEVLRDGAVPTAMVRSLAQDIEAAESTLWRWLKEDRSQTGAVPRPISHIAELTDEHIEVLFQHQGDVKKAKDALDSTDSDIAAMSYTTFRRRWHAQPAHIRAMAKDGANEAVAQQLKMLYSPSERNKIWHIDHQELPIWVLPRGHTANPVKPWLTTIIDAATRRIMSTLLTVTHANAVSTTVAVGDGVRRRELTAQGQWAGGIPDMLYSDNGGEFKSNHFKEALQRLGIAQKRSMPYMKHQNGKAERVQLTLQDDLIKRLPGYSSGPKTISMKDTFGLGGPLLGEDALVLLINEWVDHYNAERPHSSLGGKTPNQVWCSQNTELREADPEAVRLAMLLEDRDYKVQPTGVWFRGRYYMSIELGRRGLIGRKVAIRHMPGDESFIEVFSDNEWICTAIPHENLTSQQRGEIQEMTREQYMTARAFHDAAAERRRVAAFGGDGTMIVEDVSRPPTGLAAVDLTQDIADRSEPPHAAGGSHDGPVIPAGSHDDPFADTAVNLGLS